MQQETNRAINYILSHKIQFAIVSRGYSYKEVAKAIGLSPSTLSCILSRRTSCTLTNLFLISQFLDYPIHFFLDSFEIKQELYKTVTNPLF